MSISRIKLIIISLLACGNSFADSSIRLNPMKGDPRVIEEPTRSFTGSCGNSVVRVLGASGIEDSEKFDLDAAMVIIRAGGGRELTVDRSSGVFDAFTGIACVPTKFGPRLLIWSSCGGSSCSEQKAFYVIDPEQLSFLAPKDPRKGICNEKCASKLLGNDIPKKINDNTY